jgi:hypothetical protein
MKRTVLMTILAMSLTLGFFSAYVNGSCSNCGYSSADFGCDAPVRRVSLRRHIL